MTVAEDDEEDDSFMSPEASKTKTENGATGTMTEVFKAEPIGDGSIDLENDVYVRPLLLSYLVDVEFSPTLLH